jgi:hypothetical protein
MKSTILVWLFRCRGSLKGNSHEGYEVDARLHPLPDVVVHHPDGLPLGWPVEGLMRLEMGRETQKPRTGEPGGASDLRRIRDSNS